MLTIVTGTGYTGRRILSMLPANSVVGLSRSAIDTDRVAHLFDLDTPPTLPLELPPDYGVIYTVPPTGDPPDRRLSSFVSLLRPAPARFVYISTTGVYGDRGGATVTEATPVHPENDRARRRVAAEELLRDWALDTSCKLIILRAPGIYGPGRLGIERIEAGMPILDEESAHPGNRIHVDDLATCCIAALAPHVPAGLYNVGDNDHRNSTWFTNEVARQLGLPPPPQISRHQAEQEFSTQRMSFLRESRIVDTSKMRDVLGVTPRYANPEDGIRASLT
ncbi:MAG: NAD-dependent epimerase/dehydratase family protein [Gammaproteobacteria bacterium]|nr:NAD-dependent epimerase/dehydratase family protein [Gammaproteobacteria bacterium]